MFILEIYHSKLQCQIETISNCFHIEKIRKAAFSFKNLHEKRKFPLTYTHISTIICLILADKSMNYTTKNGRIAQLVEHLPYKQGVTGSSPVSPTILQDLKNVRSRIAQSVEQTTVNRWVTGSSPVSGAINKAPDSSGALYFSAFSERYPFN